MPRPAPSGSAGTSNTPSVTPQERETFLLIGAFPVVDGWLGKSERVKKGKKKKKRYLIKKLKKGIF